VRYAAADVLGVVCKLLFKLESQSGERSGCIQGKDNTRGEGQTDYVTTWYTFAMHVRAFIEQSSRRDRRLVHVLSGALSAPTTTTTNSKAKVGLGSNGNPKPKHSTPSCTPATWSIQTLLILLILSTPSLAHTHSHSLQYSPFTHPRSLKLFITLIGEALNNRHRNSVRRKEVRKGGVGGWMGLVWAFGRFCAGGGKDVEESAFRVVKQELRDGIGVLLVGVLLNGWNRDHDHVPSSTSVSVGEGGSRSKESDKRSQEEEQRDRRVERALVVVQDMIKSERGSTTREGIELLMRLVSGIGSSTVATTASYTAPRRVLLDASFDGTSLTFGPGGDEGVAGFTSEDVRQLTEGEVGRWWEVLMRVWEEGVERFLMVDVDTEEDRENGKIVYVSFIYISN
jgi:hypothetical protein